MTLLFNQAVQAHQNGRISEAEALYRQIIASDPKNFDALHLLAIVCSDTGKIQEADQYFRAAILIDANFPPCHVNYGFYLLKQKRFADALDSFAKAIALFPNYAEAWLGRGNVFRELRHHDDAFAAYNKAISLKPGLAEAHAGCGNILAELRRYDEAIAAYEKALALKPDLEFVEGERFNCKMRLCNWSNFAAEHRRLVTSVKEKKIHLQPFEFLCISSSAQEQRECARSWVVKKYPASNTPVWKGERYKHDRIRIAYVSADFREHVMSYLLAGVFECHDKSRFEVTAISIGPDDTSDIRQRLKKSFDRFIDVKADSEDEIASKIKAAEIDILLDLNGFTRGSRTGIFARRPAPVQVSYLGYPGTMGADYIDYLIADHALIPEASQVHYSEKIVTLPDSYLANGATRSISDKVFTRSALGLPEKGVVFCCFNNSYKILPDAFDRWMQILKQVEGSVLWLREDNPTAASNLKNEARHRGVAPERLVFAPRMPLSDHLARHRCADLFLDTLPYNAHATASDALWAGLPVLTQIGETFAGRVAGSLLQAIGLPELIASTQQDYIDLAIELAANPEKLAAVRRKLSQNRLTRPLFDTQLFARNIERAYEAMYERFQAGLPPEHISLPEQVG